MREDPWAYLWSDSSLFLGAHVFVTMRAPRAAVIARIGEWPYKGVMALVSLIGLILIGYGFGQYRATGWINVWSSAGVDLLRHPAADVAGEHLRGRGLRRGDIWRTLKHPMLVGVKTWAVAHLISNGDLGSIVLFGAFLAWAVYDRISLKRRSDPGAPPIPAGGRQRRRSRSWSAPSFISCSASSSTRSWSACRCSVRRRSRD